LWTLFKFDARLGIGVEQSGTSVQQTFLMRMSAVSPPKPVAPPTFVVDSSSVGLSAAFADFEAAVADVFAVKLVSPPRTAALNVVSWHLGSVMLGLFHGPAMTFERTPGLVAKSGLSHILVQVYLEGGFIGLAGAARIKVGPGDICVFDLTKTLKTQTTDFGNLTLLAPRAELRPYFEDMGRLHGAVLACGDPFSDLLKEYMSSLAARLDVLNSRQAMLAAGPTTALLGVVLASHTLSSSGGRASHGQTSNLRKVGDYIDRHIGDPRLNAAQISRDVGLSRATLYRVCAASGGVANLVRRRRLSGAALQLADPLGTARISEVADRWGFADNAAFARAFREAFGISPREARKRGSAPVSTGPDGAVDPKVFADWMRLLRTTAS
jgi:AraC-like DNA-binding protein